MYRVLGYGTVYCTQSGGGGGSIFFSKHKINMYTFVQQREGWSRRDPIHKSMYKCAYMYVHLSLSPPPPPPGQYDIQ